METCCVYIDWEFITVHHQRGGKKLKARIYQKIWKDEAKDHDYQVSC
jgi:hypothetical protein